MSQPTPSAPQLDYRSAAASRERLLSPGISRALASILGPLIGLLIVIAIFGIWKPRLFLTQGNLVNVLTNNYHYAVAAVGMTFVIITAGIDLSVGSTMALACVSCAMAIKGVRFPARDLGTSIGIGAAIALLVGLCIAGRQLQAGRHARGVLTTSLIAGGASGLFVAVLWLVLAGHALPPMPAFIAVLIGVAVGTIAGFVNGSLITTLGLPPFIVTLATLVIFRGLVLDIAGGTPISLDRSWSASARASMNALHMLHFGSIGGFPPNVWIALLVVLIGAPLLHFTVVGRYAYAIGSNERTARLCGVNVERYKTLCYMIGGATAGLAGVMMTAKFTGGEPTEFNGAELTVIAAVVIGGTSLFGGEGTIIGSVLGALMLGMLYSGCVIADISPFKQLEFIGGTILLAAALDRFRHLRG
jgi:ribose/xylose/arabinose/galactoside ABC-type transport system permease subunit